MTYKKSQTGWIGVLLIGSVLIFITILYAFQLGSKPVPLIPFVLIFLLFTIILLLFYQLTIKASPTGLEVIYGIGLIRINKHIDKLVSTQVFDTPWYWGLGIRITPEGTLFNIQGTKALKIDYLDGGKEKTVLIGSAEPELLKTFLEDNLRSAVH